MSSPTGPEKRVYLHIGLQKTGTTYLQKIFLQSTDQLAAQGLDMVPATRREAFELMLDVRKRVDPAFDREDASDALHRLPDQLRRARGDRALISEEALAEARLPRIKALLAACGEREVHVVVTLRDLGRQIPSAWQQMIQSGSDVVFEDYLENLRTTRQGNPAWANKDVVKLLRRWSRVVPPARIHVVTVPPSGSDPELLLQRFCTVLGVDHTRLDVLLDRQNQSLGRVEAEVARSVNARLDAGNRTREVYGDVGKRYFAVRVLGARPGRKILLPLADEAWVRAVSQEFATHLRRGTYDVVGDPDDLLPSASAFADPEHGRPSAEEIAETATAALATVLDDRMDALRERRAKDRAKRARQLRARGRQPDAGRLDRARGRVAGWLGRASSAVRRVAPGLTRR